MTAPSESHFEVRPVRTKFDEVFLCEPADANMWSVYERDAEGLPQWLADCGTEADARRLVTALEAQPRIRQQLDSFLRSVTKWTPALVRSSTSIC